MRSTKELLEVLLDQYENNKDDTIRLRGLCHAVIIIRYRYLITRKEERLLIGYLKKNRPKRYSLTGFWWPRGHAKPRIEFLKKLISEL